jgi:hypothetical protein
MSISKDSKIEDLRIDQQHLLVKANLVAKTSEAPSIVSFSSSDTLTARVITIDLKEPVKSCERVQIVNRASGASEDKLASAPSISGNSISITLDATGLSDVCIVVSYRK